jgi:hypothetical protein
MIRYELVTFKSPYSFDECLERLKDAHSRANINTKRLLGINTAILVDNPKVNKNQLTFSMRAHPRKFYSLARLDGKITEQNDQVSVSCTVKMPLNSFLLMTFVIACLFAFVSRSILIGAVIWLLQLLFEVPLMYSGKKRIKRLLYKLLV